MNRFKNILVTVKEHGDTEAVMARARWLAEANGAAITLMHTVETEHRQLTRLLSVLPGHRAAEINAALQGDQAIRLDARATPLRDAGHDVRTVVAHGTGFIETIRRVLSHDHDLVLKGAENTPMRQVLRGPDLHLLRKCPCPVWVLNNAQGPKSRRIVAAVDPDPDNPESAALNTKVMQLATSLARQDNAKVDVLHAWYLHEEAAMRTSRVGMTEEEIAALLAEVERESADHLNALLADFTECKDILRVIHVKGRPEDVIVEHAENERIDTLVMGTLARTGLAGLFIGNTAETVLNRVGCSVVAVKPDGFVSPVTLPEGGLQ
jgi:universal stress protein E